MELKRNIGIWTAILIIVADVIGTGIFMTTGKVLGMTGSAPVVLILWGVGGLMALTGSLCYAELATMWPQDGGEYNFLKNIYGLLPSFLTGWISLVVGFTASAAISAILVVIYLNEAFHIPALSNPWTQKFTASAIILVFGISHVIGVRRGSVIQNSLTVLKLFIVFSLIVLGFYMADWSGAERLSMTYDTAPGRSVLEYGSALLIIMYAYSGWNGTSYIAGEVKDPAKTLPRAMFFGTLAIVVIYMLLNTVYLISSPGSELMGKDAVGSIASRNLFGEGFSSLYSLGIAIILLSSVSVQLMVGPRVYYAMAKDRMIFSFMERINPRFNTPDLSIIIQTAITVFYVFIGIENIISLLIYLGFALGIFPLLSVIGMVITRYKQPGLERPFRVPFFPLVPAVYIILSLTTMATSLYTSTKASLVALAVVALGIAVFYLWQIILKKRA